MYLVVTSKRDLTSDFIILELQRRSLPYLRLNTEDLPKGTFNCRPSADDDWSFELPNVSFKLSSVAAAYFRRPGQPELLHGLSESEQHYSAGEWHAALQSLYWTIGQRWLNAPHAIALAENKVRQLTLARSIGFKIPDTLIGNDPAAASVFANRTGIVGKALRSAVIKGEQRDRIVFTSRVRIDADTDPLSIRANPFILQSEVKKKFDVRATVIGDRVFAATIDSQRHEATEVDWRRTSEPDLPHCAYSLPERVEEQCIALVRKLGLRFGAVDLVLDKDDQHWFLEINPNGQWGWIESRTGHPIAAAIVTELHRIANAKTSDDSLAAT